MTSCQGPPDVPWRYGDIRSHLLLWLLLVYYSLESLGVPSLVAVVLCVCVADSKPLASVAPWTCLSTPIRCTIPGRVTHAPWMRFLPASCAICTPESPAMVHIN